MDRPLFRELDGLETQVETHLDAVRRIAGALAPSSNPQRVEAPPSPPPSPPLRMSSLPLSPNASRRSSSVGDSPPPNAVPVSPTLTDDVETTKREVEELLRSVKEAEAAIQDAICRATMNSASPSVQWATRELSDSDRALPQLSASRLPLSLPLPPLRPTSPLRPHPPPGVLLATPPPLAPSVAISAARERRAVAARQASEARRAALAAREREEAHEQRMLIEEDVARGQRVIAAQQRVLEEQERSRSAQASEARRAALAAREREEAHEQRMLIEEDVARGQRVIAAQQRVLEEQERSFRALLRGGGNSGVGVAAESRGSGGDQPTPIRFDAQREKLTRRPPPPRASPPMYPRHSQAAAPMSSPLPRFSPPLPQRWEAHGGLLPAPPAPCELGPPSPADGVDVAKSRPGVALGTFEPTKIQLLGHAIAVKYGEEVWLAVGAPALVGAAPAGWCWVTARATGRAGFVPETFIVHAESAEARAMRKESGTSAGEPAKHERLVAELKMWQTRNAEQMTQLARQR